MSASTSEIESPSLLGTDLEDLCRRAAKWERWRRRGVMLMYSPVAGFVLLAVGALISWLGGGSIVGSAQNTTPWDIPFMVAGVFLLLSPAFIVLGMVLRSAAAVRLDRSLDACGDVASLPASPQPYFDEDIGRHRVHLISDEVLLLVRRWERLLIAMRIFVAILMAGCAVAVAFAIFAGGFAWSSCVAGVVWVFAAIGGLGWAMRSRCSRWYIITESEPMLGVEHRDVLTRRRLEEFSSDEVRGFSIVEVEGIKLSNWGLVLNTEEKGSFLLMELDGGRWPYWQMRRLLHAINARMKPKSAWVLEDEELLRSSPDALRREC